MVHARSLIGAQKPRMLRLAARYGDMWNTGYFGDVQSFAEERAAFEAARTESGGADNVQITATLKVAWSDLGEPPGFFGEHYLAGSSEHIASVLRDFAESGVSHVICQYHPTNPAALERLVAAVGAYRSAGNS